MMYNVDTITLDEISQRKKMLTKQLRQKKRIIRATANELITPLPVRNKMDLGYKWLSNGLALYDGLKLGFRIIRYFRK